MNDIQINLTGWKAVVAIALFLIFVWFRYQTIQSSAEVEAVEQIKMYLVAEYSQVAMNELAKYNIDEDRDEYEEAAQNLVERTRVTFASVSAMGVSEPVVRVEVLVNGEPPTVGEPVRYYRMNYSSITGWSVKWESSAFSYYTALF